jgi:hypothetical protein
MTQIQGPAREERLEETLAGIGTSFLPGRSSGRLSLARLRLLCNRLRVTCVKPSLLYLFLIRPRFDRVLRSRKWRSVQLKYTVYNHILLSHSHVGTAMAADEFAKLENFQRGIQDFHRMNPAAFTRRTHTAKGPDLGDRTLVKYGNRVYEGRCARTHCQRSRAQSVRHYHGRLHEGNVYCTAKLEATWNITVHDHFLPQQIDTFEHCS